MISGVSLRLLYLIFQHMLGLLLRMARTSNTKDIELLVLRHEVAVLRRTSPDPAWSGRTEPCSPRSSGACRERCVAIAWSPQAPSCAGIAVSCVRGGLIRTCPDGHRSTRRSRR